MEKLVGEGEDIDTVTWLHNNSTSQVIPFHKTKETNNQKDTHTHAQKHAHTYTEDLPTHIHTLGLSVVTNIGPKSSGLDQFFILLFDYCDLWLGHISAREHGFWQCWAV